MENHVIYDELVNRCSTIGGGVNNVQSDLTTLQNDVTTIKNNMTANQGAVRTIQRGTVNKNSTFSAGDSYRSYTVNIPIAAISNTSKCYLYYNIDVSSEEFYGRTRKVSATLYSTYIQVSFEALNTSGNTIAVNARGDWQIIEFY